MYADYDEDEKKRQLMLRVDNVNGGAAEIHEIRGILYKKLKSFPRIPIPVSWFVLCLRIRDYRYPTMKLSDFKEWANQLNIEPDEEFPTALWFLHHGLGVILYFPKEGLKNTVFCKMEAVYESVAELIAKTYAIKNIKHDSSLDEFKNLGIFSLEEIRSEVHESPIPRRLLIQLLEELNIVTSAPPELSPTRIKNPYFMPCKLQISRDPIDIPERNPL